MADGTPCLASSSSVPLREGGGAKIGVVGPAESLGVPACTGIFTHFKREEIAPGGLLLCNESFASTNEREGSEIARQVIRALTEGGPDGGRTFWLSTGEPLPTSYGEELYREIFGAAHEKAPA
jgi:hypothetical protein